jgi:hypothetical protein
MAILINFLEHHEEALSNALDNYGIPVKALDIWRVIAMVLFIMVAYFNLMVAMAIACPILINFINYSNKKKRDDDD